MVLAGTVGSVLVDVVVLVLVGGVGADPVAGVSVTDLVVGVELVAAAVAIVLLACILPSRACEVVITSVLFTAVVSETILAEMSIGLLVAIETILVVVVIVISSVILLVPVDVSSVVVSVIISMIEAARPSSLIPDPDIKYV